MILPKEYYQSTDVCSLAKDLLGKLLITKIDNHFCSGIISETEAYRGPDDKASHSFANRRTPRNETMYKTGGTAYIYICYGIHHLFNVISGPENCAHAILIRAVDPVEGIPQMIKRRKLPVFKNIITKGPGALSQALGIAKHHDGCCLWSRDSIIQIHEANKIIQDSEIGTSKRIGVESAGPAAHYPWRYFLKSSPYVSAHKKLFTGEY